LGKSVSRTSKEDAINRAVDHSELVSANSKPNAAAFVSGKGLDFAVEVATPFVSSALSKALTNLTLAESMALPIPPEAMGLKLELQNVSLDGSPKVAIIPKFTKEGALVSVSVDLKASASVSVPNPSSTGTISIGFAGVIEAGFAADVKDHKLHFSTYKVSVSTSNVDIHLAIVCKRRSFFDFATCTVIEAMNGEVPSFLVDMLKSTITGVVEDTLKQAINEDLSKDFAEMPMSLPIPDFGHGARLQVNFMPVSISGNEVEKAATMQILTVDTKTNRTFPVPGMNLLHEDSEFNQSMLGVSFSQSTVNSLFWSVYQMGALRYTILPSMLPSNTLLGLDTNAISALFYAPWLKMSYAWSCPWWKPCPIQMTLASSEAPEIHLESDVLLLTVPVMMDFSVNVSGRLDFLWRVSTTLSTGAQMAISTNDEDACADQKLEFKVSSFKVDWLDVTKTADDSWVSVAYTLNAALKEVLNKQISTVLSDGTAQGIPLKGLPIGSTTLKAHNTFIFIENGVFKFASSFGICNATQNVSR